MDKPCWTLMSTWAEDANKWELAWWDQQTALWNKYTDYSLGIQQGKQINTQANIAEKKTSNGLPVPQQDPIGLYLSIKAWVPSKEIQALWNLFQIFPNLIFGIFFTGSSQVNTLLWNISESTLKRFSLQYFVSMGERVFTAQQLKSKDEVVKENHYMLKFGWVKLQHSLSYYFIMPHNFTPINTLKLNRWSYDEVST